MKKIGIESEWGNTKYFMRLIKRTKQYNGSEETKYLTTQRGTFMYITDHRLRITHHTLPIADRDTRESPVREMVKELKEFGVEAYGYDPLLSKEEIEGFGVRALDDMLQITDHRLLPEGRMDGVIVALGYDK